jgi:hypothetical protein
VCFGWGGVRDQLIGRSCTWSFSVWRDGHACGGRWIQPFAMGNRGLYEFQFVCAWWGEELDGYPRIHPVVRSDFLNNTPSDSPSNSCFVAFQPWNKTHHLFHAPLDHKTIFNREENYGNGPLHKDGFPFNHKEITVLQASIWRKAGTNFQHQAIHYFTPKKIRCNTALFRIALFYIVSEVSEPVWDTPAEDFWSSALKKKQFRMFKNMKILVRAARIPCEQPWLSLSITSRLRSGFLFRERETTNELLIDKAILLWCREAVKERRPKAQMGSPLGTTQHREPVMLKELPCPRCLT